MLLFLIYKKEILWYNIIKEVIYMAKNKKIKKPGILAEFKQFITRGNVIDMATGVIVASAFTKIVTSLTNSVFLPLVNYIVYLITVQQALYRKDTYC